jgi:CrcB protein
LATTQTWLTVLAVGVGAALGAVMRWAAGLWMNSAWHGFPLGTLLVNCAGGLMIGVLMVVFERWPSGLHHAFLVTGLLGGLTTFSAFSGESLQLLHRGQAGMALLHVAAHLFGSLGCAAAGFTLARLVLRG